MYLQALKLCCLHCMPQRKQQLMVHCKQRIGWHMHHAAYLAHKAACSTHWKTQHTSANKCL